MDVARARGSGPMKWRGEGGGPGGEGRGLKRGGGARAFSELAAGVGASACRRSRRPLQAAGRRVVAASPHRSRHGCHSTTSPAIAGCCGWGGGLGWAAGGPARGRGKNGAAHFGAGLASTLQPRHGPIRVRHARGVAATTANPLWMGCPGGLDGRRRLAQAKGEEGAPPAAEPRPVNSLALPPLASHRPIPHPYPPITHRPGVCKQGWVRADGGRGGRLVAHGVCGGRGASEELLCGGGVARRALHPALAAPHCFFALALFFDCACVPKRGAHTPPAPTCPPQAKPGSP